MSIGRAGSKSNGPNYSPTVSDDGRYVAFSSDATNLVAGDTNGKRGVFRADLHTGMTVRVSVAGSGSQGNDASDRGKISGNGSAIAFESGASNLVARDTNHATDIFLRDLPGTIRRVSLMPTGDQLSNAASQATISNDGARVGFMGLSGSSDAIFQWSRRLQRTTILSEEASDHQVGSPVTSNGGVSSAGEETNFDCWNSGISVTASPKSESFYIDDDCGSTVDYGYDVSRWGAMASIAYFDYSINATLLYVVDDYFELSYPDRYPPLARKRVNASAVSMAADGSRVGYATTIGGISQIQLWNWKTGATATVSTS